MYGMTLIYITKYEEFIKTLGEHLNGVSYKNSIAMVSVTVGPLFAEMITREAKTLITTLYLLSRLYHGRLMLMLGKGQLMLQYQPSGIFLLMSICPKLGIKLRTSLRDLMIGLPKRSEII